MRLSVRFVLILTLLYATPQTVVAQFDAVTALFKDVHSIALYGQAAYLDNLELRGGDRCIVDELLCGIGTEVLIDVGKESGAHVELGLGASYLSGVEAKDANLELNGAIRSFPTVSAYITDLHIKHVPGEYYFGGGIGLAELMNAQAYDSLGVERDVKGSTFELGFTGGTYIPVRPWMGGFLELSWRWRRFASLDYTLVDADSGRVPPSWPRELHFGGPSVAFGVQFRLKHDPPAAPIQVWALAAVNAQELPAPVTASASEESVEQTQIVFGSLTLTVKDSSYVLQVVSRHAVLSTDGTVEALPGTPESRAETGTFRVTSGQWSLDPNGPVHGPAAYPIIRMGDDFVIRDRVTGSMLTFHKPGSAPPAASGDAKKSDDSE